MPFRTRYGTHYHESQGCPAIAGKTVMPCSADGLTPCSICCKGAKAGSSGGDAPISGTTIRAGGREVHVDGDVIETRKVGVGFSTMADGTLYRLDRNLSDDEANAVNSLPGVTFMPDESSLDRTQKTSAFIVSDAAPKSEVRYAADLASLGVRTMVAGASLPASVPDSDVRAWLAATGEGGWKSTKLPGLRIDESVEPIHEPEGDGWPARTFYTFEGAQTMHDLTFNDDLRWFTQFNEHVRYGTRNGRGGLIVDEGHELVFRNTDDGTRIGVRRHYDTPLLKDMSDAEWTVDRSTRRGDVVSCEGAAYRTPAGDAVIKMTISPDPRFPGRVRTTVRVTDPYIGKVMTLVNDDDSESLEYAKDKVCGYALRRANKGTETLEIERAYERALPDLAVRDAEEDGMIVERVIPVNRHEVEVRALAGGYEPVRLRYMYGGSSDGDKLQCYHK